jgi:antitoxin HigA-1
METDKSAITASGANGRLARLLALAVDRSRRSRREIAREADMNKATFLKALRGERPISLDEANRILAASDAPTRLPIVLALLDENDLAERWLDDDAGTFLEGLIVSLPYSLDEAIGGRSDELNPRWAIGTSRLVAKVLAKHIEEIAAKDPSQVLG